MCFISNWDLVWPLTMISKGGLGDWAIVVIWVICLIIGLCLPILRYSPYFRTTGEQLGIDLEKNYNFTY